MRFHTSAKAPANLKCKLVDASLVTKYILFVFEVVKAHVATSPKFPTTTDYRGDGLFYDCGGDDE
jgi:flavin reductase (DIM6/NTAB) family NADH-FMN oxidoreductase RutF